jgi:glycosyltransferase involved in cell wall biosynthesis
LINIPGKVFVVVPCFNEASIVYATVSSLLNCTYQVVVVDDGSVDDTREKLRGLPVYFLRHQINLGQGAAIQTGIDFALQQGADFLVTFDADGQHEVKDILKMLVQLREEQVDFVFGSRFLAGSKTNVDGKRKVLLQISRLTNFFISGILLSDANNGIRVFTSAAAKKIRLKENRRTHSADLIYQVAKNKIKYAECPVCIHYSEYSKMKGIQNKEGFSIFLNMLLYKFFR